MSGGIDERTARAVWSVIAEPTDAVARLAWTVHGAATSLDWVDSASDEALCEAIGHALRHGPRSEVSITAAHDGATAMRSGDIGAIARAAAQRWRARLNADAWTVIDDSAMQGIRAVIPGDSEWPGGFDDLGVNAPVCMWARGQVRKSGLGPERSVAIVGSRAATSYGVSAASEMAANLARRGATVVSGGAFGIDAAAHRGALAEGHTVAFLACGLDELYPRSHADLLTRIINHGALYSEAPIDTRPTRWRFLARNRLIAAASGVTVVVEAAWRSGALSTASHADGLSRPVAAVPGPVTSAASSGCHRLIRERGAVLVTGADDVAELIGECGSTAADKPQILSDVELLGSSDRLVYDGIPPRSAIAITALAREVAQSPEQVARSLARIELLGLAKVAGAQVRRVKAA